MPATSPHNGKWAHNGSIAFSSNLAKANQLKEMECFLDLGLCHMTGHMTVYVVKGSKVSGLF